MKRSVKANIWRRVNTNRARIEEARDREEREAEALRALSQKAKEQQK
jgi:hypothetical protein